MRDFRKLEIWKEAMDLTDLVYGLTDTFPNHELYGLTSQIRRCSISVPSNIAEGCRGSNKELIYFLNISLGSSFELETQIEIATRQKYINDEIFQKALLKLHSLQKRINAFRTYVKKANFPTT